jgi:hypothetical protein
MPSSLQSMVVCARKVLTLFHIADSKAFDAQSRTRLLMYNCVTLSSMFVGARNTLRRELNIWPKLFRFALSRHVEAAYLYAPGSSQATLFAR